jgi:hypothetical protein
MRRPTAIPSSAPAKTSPGKCTPRYTREKGTANAHVTANTMSHRPGREAIYTVSKAHVVAAWPETKPKAPRHVATARNSPSRAQQGRGRPMLFLRKVAIQSAAAKAATRVIKSQNQALGENFGRWNAQRTSQTARATQMLETAAKRWSAQGPPWPATPRKTERSSRSSDSTNPTANL